MIQNEVKEVEDTIIRIVESRNGLKATQLGLLVLSDLQDRKLPIADVETYIKLVQKLIDEGRLVEVEYSVPAIPYRIKSFLLPAGSTVRPQKRSRHKESLEKMIEKITPENRHPEI